MLKKNMVNLSVAVHKPQVTYFVPERSKVRRLVLASQDQSGSSLHKNEAVKKQRARITDTDVHQSQTCHVQARLGWCLFPNS